MSRSAYSVAKEAAWADELPTAVSDCAPPSRGAAVCGPRRLRLPASKAHDLSPLDSGFISGLQSPADPLSPPALRFPKEAARRQAGAGDGQLSAELSAELSGLRVEEERLSGAERKGWERCYLAVLDEAFRGDEDGDTHLHLAIIYGLDRVADCLIRLVPHPDFLNLRNSYLQTPLHLAALTGQASLCRHLLVAGAVDDLRDRHGNTPLHLACERADLRCVAALTAPVSVQETRQAAPRYWLPPVGPPPPIDEWNYQGLSCLHLATLSGDLGLVAHLVTYGADVSAVEGKSGRSPLHLAVEAGNVPMLRLLAEACGADVRATTYAGLSCYQLALLNARLDVAELLEMLGAASESLPDSGPETSDSESEMFVKPEDFFSDVRIRGRPLVSAP